jgi:4-alpha-glucanotransferase
LCGKIKLATIVKIKNVAIISSQEIEFTIHSNTMNIPQNMGPNENYNIVSPLRTRANEKN